MKKLALWNVGPVSNEYAGPHTYSDVFIPFANECIRQGLEVHWIGLSLQNRQINTKLGELGITQSNEYIIKFDTRVKPLSVSWDFINTKEYDALLCQPRPDACEIENIILMKTINKFLDAGKRVFIWELDLFLDRFDERMRNECILLHAAQLPPKKFKIEIYFPMFMHSEYSTFTESIRDLDFLLVANVYGRNQQALQFFKQMEHAHFNKLIFGSWIANAERIQFATQFKNFEFVGSCEHWAATPLMRRARMTLHIVPDFARDRGLMTARVFVSQMNSCLCFCDAGIVGAELFFPKELIVKDGNEIVERWDYVQQHRERLLAERNELLKNYTVERRVQEFITLL